MTSAREKKTLIHHITHRNTIIVIVSSHGHFGADCELLESMGEFCCQGGGGRRWPRIIKFETRGLANTLFNPEKEDQTIGLLQWWGYNVVYSGNDTVLLHAPTMSRNRRFRKWADARYPLRCHRCSFATQPSHAWFSYHTRKGSWQWDNNRWMCPSCAGCDRRKGGSNVVASTSHRAVAGRWG